jgi:hypothetical protein
LPGTKVEKAMVLRKEIENNFINKLCN